MLESLARQAAIAIENAALYRDLEEKKARVADSLRAVEQLYKREQQVSRHLQELHLMRTNFMIVTSHEMRTPLTLLRGYVEALQQGFLGAPSPAQASALGYCRRTVERMIASFNDILEMLQLGQRSVALARQPISLAAVARGVIDELGPFVERRRQRLALEAPDDLPLVSADPEKLRLVLLNLIENAIKFTPDAGSIRVRVAADAAQLRVDVEDDGIGIEPEELPRVFEQFYTSPDPRHHHSGSFEFEARGAGLGLAIAKGYVEAHGGRIWAESPGRGRGSRFHVLLPIAAEQQAKTA